jgi:hypothetical protein
MKKYFVMTLVGCNLFSCAMEKEQSPLGRAKAKQVQQQQLDDQDKKDAEIIRDKIDQDILGINTESYLRRAIGTYYSRQKNGSLTTQQEVVDTVDAIGSYFSTSGESDSTVSWLYHKHSLFAYLTNRLIEHEVNYLKSVQGKSLDTMLSKERKVCASESINKYVKEKALRQYSWQKQGRTDWLPAITFNEKEKDIHFAPLFGHSDNFDIGADGLLMSSDSKYLRCRHGGNTTVWNMETAQVIDSAEIEKYTAWTRLDEGNHHCRRQRVLDKNGKYLATPGMALAFGNWSTRAIENSVKENCKFPVIMLFVRPTVESLLSQDALINSNDNEEELKALQNSQLVNDLEGLPAVNIKALIAEELKKFNTQARL